MREPPLRVSSSADTTAAAIDALAVWRTCPDCKERVNAYAFETCSGCGHEACIACVEAWDWWDDDEEFAEGFACRRCRGV